MGRIALPGALALVTGAGSGIGRATALALAGKGASIVCVDIDGAAAEKVAAECGEKGAPGTAALRVDVADGDAVAEMAARVAGEHGVPDVLVNNAGVGMSGRLDAMSLEDWRWIRGINLDGVVHGCHAFGPAMLERGRGQIVNISSGLAFVPTSTEIAYGTTKAGVLMFSRALRVGWADRGVGVSAICPGVIRTPIIDRTRFLGEQAEPERREQAVRLFRRGHRPELVARAVVRAIEGDRAMVAVGFESKLGWAAHRLVPLALQDAVARRAR